MLGGWFPREVLNLFSYTPCILVYIDSKVTEGAQKHRENVFPAQFRPIGHLLPLLDGSGSQLGLSRDIPSPAYQ